MIGSSVAPVSREGKVLFVGSVFNGMQYGSYEVMRRLLHQYDSNSFGIVSASYRSDASYDFASQVLTVGFCRLPTGKLGAIVSMLQIPLMFIKAFLSCRKSSYVAIVAVHPSMDMLLVALLLAKWMRLPLFPYLHDTIVEAQEKSRLAPIARWTQRSVFSAARKILVMSEGMQTYYRRIYGVKSVVVPHIYSESPSADVSSAHMKTLFWSGGIYGINDHAVLEVVKAATSLGVTTRITAPGGAARARVEAWRQKGLLVEAVYYPERKDYIEALRVQGAHVLALNHPSASEFGEGELATIFPTKTPDYLASGRPVLVFCPNHYELATYFSKHRCGVVVSQPEDLQAAIQEILSDNSATRDMVRNGLNLVKGFSPKCVAETLSAAIDG